MSKFNTLKARHGPRPDRRRGDPVRRRPTRAAPATRTTPRASCSCSPSPTSSARTPSTRRRPTATRATRRSSRPVAVADPDVDRAVPRAGCAPARTCARRRSSARSRRHTRMLGAGMPGGRQLVASVLQRADEPGEALAYWTSTYGRAMPEAGQAWRRRRGRPAVHRAGLLKYDTAAHGFRFGDVIDLVHPTPGGRRRGRATCSSTRSTGVTAATTAHPRRCGCSPRTRRCAGGAADRPGGPRRRRRARAGRHDVGGRAVAGRLGCRQGDGCGRR